MKLQYFECVMHSYIDIHIFTVYVYIYIKTISYFNSFLLFPLFTVSHNLQMSFYIGEPGTSCHSLCSSDICYVYFVQKSIFTYMLCTFSAKFTRFGLQNM